MTNQEIRERLAVWPQYAVPQHLLSRAAGWLAECRVPAIKDTFIEQFARIYQVNMHEAEQPDLSAYACFNDFFTRALKAGVRPICEHGVASPADGAVSQVGSVQNGQVFQAKGHSYSLTALLGGDTDRAAQFQNGVFATIYLSPRDYHRVHMPFDGRLTEMVYVPGRLFSVNSKTARQVPGLFARNERVVCYFDTEIGPMALILVGAMIVASIETVWAGLVAPPRRVLKTYRYESDPQALAFKKGQEMGRFKLGSTAIVLLPEQTVQWRDDLKEGTSLKMGELLGTLL